MHHFFSGKVLVRSNLWRLKSQLVLMSSILMVKEAANPSSSFATWQKIKPVISHDNENRTLAKENSSPGSYESAVHYYGVSSSCISQLANLTAISSHCEQFIKYECYGTVLYVQWGLLWLVGVTWSWKNWGGAGPGDSYKCACGVARVHKLQLWMQLWQVWRWCVAWGQRFSHWNVSSSRCSSHRAKIWRFYL